MISIEFTRARAQATRDTQASLGLAPTTWVWSQKTVIQWDGEIATLDQCLADESARRTQWRNAAESWQASLNGIQALTRQVVSIGRVHFRNDAVKLLLWESVSTDAESRAGIYEQGLAARDVWQETDPAWNVSTEISVGTLSSALTDALAKQAAHSAKFTAWRRASATLTNKAQQVDVDCIAWYAEATRRFLEATPDGDFIRSSVPRTTRTDAPVGQAVLSNLVVNAGTIHFDVTAPGATRYTYLQQSPGSPAFVVVLADSPEAGLTLTAQPNGLHRFKVIGSNSGGSGAESAVAELSVSIAAAA